MNASSSRAVSLSDVLITPTLAHRKTRPFSEDAACVFKDIAHKVSRRVDGVLQYICQQALVLCDAQSVFIHEHQFDHQDQVLQLVAQAGRITQLKAFRSPRFFSPCGTTLSLYSYQLFAHPERHFEWLQDYGLIIPEMMVFPIYKAHFEPAGTLVVTVDRQFDYEDVRILSAMISYIKICMGLTSPGVLVQAIKSHNGP